MTRSTLQLLEQREDVTIALATLIEFDLLLDALPGRIESLAIEGLEQVVERVYLKGAYGILIVGSDKDDVWSRAAVKRFQHFETAQLWHLYVQKDEVGLQRLDRFYCFTTIHTLRNNLDFRLTFQHLANHLASKWFVVDD